MSTASIPWTEVESRVQCDGCNQMFDSDDVLVQNTRYGSFVICEDCLLEQECRADIREAESNS